MNEIMGKGPTRNTLYIKKFVHILYIKSYVPEMYTENIRYI